VRTASDGPGDAGPPDPSDEPDGPAVGAEPTAGRVLLIEDNAVSQVVALGILGELGFVVDVATDSAQALEMAQSGGPYLAVFVDCQESALNAYDVARRWRAREREAPDGPHTPIIAMAEAVVPGDREQCLAAGMDDYLTKPMQPDTVTTSLSRWLGTAIDQDQIEELRGLPAPGGQSPLAEMIQSFLTQGPAAVDDLADAVNRRDTAALASHAHGLKGMASALGASGMTEMCSAMAAQARAGDLDGAEVTMQRLRAEFDRAGDELRQIAQSASRAG
jgi:two-component system sensor histidine kinase/response regulator